MWVILTLKHNLLFIWNSNLPEHSVFLLSNFGKFKPTTTNLEKMKKNLIHDHPGRARTTGKQRPGEGQKGALTLASTGQEKGAAAPPGPEEGRRERPADAVRGVGREEESQLWLNTPSLSFRGKERHAQLRAAENPFQKHHFSYLFLNTVCDLSKCIVMSYGKCIMYYLIYTKRNLRIYVFTAQF